jgi:hypothetical protein
MPDLTKYIKLNKTVAFLNVLDKLYARKEKT